MADLTDYKQRKALINYFVNAVVLYDDDAIFYLNYKENALKLSLSKIKKCSDSLLNPLPLPRNILVPRLFYAPNTAFYGGIRAFFLCLKIL